MNTNKGPGMFSSEFRIRKLDSIGDPLAKLKKIIDWEEFRKTLEEWFKHEEPTKAPGGRPGYDLLLRFKILVLQSLYNLSDEAMEFQLNDRRTFQRFIDLDDNDTIPDAKTIWLWREVLSKKHVFTKLFDRFWEMLDRQNVKTSSGTIIDATFVDKPRQRNSKNENDSIKNGKIPEDWEKPENEAMLRQKDIDARWTKKNDETHYGYKNHVKVDSKTKLVRKCVITDASVHDSQTLDQLLDTSDTGKSIYADSAYSGEKQIEIIKNHKAKPRVCEKGYRNMPLMKKQITRNRKLSKTRARIEHVFGFMTMSMGGLVIRCVGMARASAIITLKNLVYNMCRSIVIMNA